MSVQTLARVAERDASAVPVRKEPSSVLLLSVFIASLFLLPARFTVVGSGAVGRPALLTGIAAMAAWVFYSFLPSRRARRRWQPMRWALAGYLLAMALAYMFGLDRGLPGIEARATDREMLALMSLAGVALVAMDGLPSRAALQRVLLRLQFFAAIMAGVGAVQFLFHYDPTRLIRIPGLVLNRQLINVSERGTGGVPRVAGTAGHYIEFGVVLAIVLPIAIHYARFAVTRRERLARRLSVLLIAVGIPFSVSRAGVVAFVVAMTVAAAGWGWRLRSNALAAVLLGTVGLRVLVPGLVGTIRALFTHWNQDPSIADRKSDYAAVGQYISERRLFGRGPGTFLPDEYVLLDNQWLYQVVTTGYVGTVAFAALFVAALVLVASIRHYTMDEQTADLAQALAASIATAAVTAFFFDSMSFAVYSGVLFLLLGCLGALWQVAELPRRLAETTDAHPHVLLS